MKGQADTHNLTHDSLHSYMILATCAVEEVHTPCFHNSRPTAIFEELNVIHVEPTCQPGTAVH